MPKQPVSPLARGITTTAALAAAAIAGGCDIFPEGGYDKVAYRTQDEIEAPVAPPPPRYVAGLGAGAGEVPVLAAAATPPGVNQEMVEQGAELYSSVCVACHGAGGAGTGAGPSLRDEEWINISGSFDEIVNVIHTGVPSPQQFAAAMPPLGGGNFDEDQVRALAAYVFALTHAE